MREEILMGEECLICGAALEYLQRDEEMECAVCHRRQESRTRCVNGHYVCSACHMKGLDSILALCLRSGSRDPVEILEESGEFYIVASVASDKTALRAGDEIIVSAQDLYDGKVVR